MVMHNFVYNDESFYEYIVTDQDFDFMKLLLKDNFDWELTGTLHHSLNTYFSYKNVRNNLFKKSIYRTCQSLKIQCWSKQR
jgi:hypothetical protein